MDAVGLLTSFYCWPSVSVPHTTPLIPNPHAYPLTQTQKETDTSSIFGHGQVLVVSIDLVGGWANFTVGSNYFIKGCYRAFLKEGGGCWIKENAFSPVD